MDNGGCGQEINILQGAPVRVQIHLELYIVVGTIQILEQTRLRIQLDVQLGPLCLIQKDFRVVQLIIACILDVLLQQLNHLRRIANEGARVQVTRRLALHLGITVCEALVGPAVFLCREQQLSTRFIELFEDLLKRSCKDDIVAVGVQVLKVSN